MSVMDDGQYTCTNSQCGIIGEMTIDMSSEGNTSGREGNDKNTDNTRHGCAINPLLQESSFGAQIICGPGASAEMKYLSCIVKWKSMPPREKTLYHEFLHITNMAQNAGIPNNIIDHAHIIHKCNSEQQLYRGKNRDGVKAASIYIACILNGCPRNPHEIAKIFCIDKESAMFGCTQAMDMIHKLKLLNEQNDIGIGIDGLNLEELTNIQPIQFISRYSCILNVPQDVTQVARFIANKLQGHIGETSKPHSVAAGIIYYLSHYLHLHISKSQISAVCGVSDVTIGNCFKRIDAIRPMLIPSIMLERYRSCVSI